MRLFSSTATALVVVVAMTSSQCCAAQARAAEQATTNRVSRAEPQHEPLLERNLSDNKTPRRQEGSLSRRTLKFLLEETQTYNTQKIRLEEYIPPEENNHDKDEARQLQEGQQPICNICGEGKKVGNPDATAPVPGGQIPCDILQNMGIVGLIPSAQCDVLTLLIGTVCECEATNNPTTATTTTTGATNAPIITTEVTSANSTIIVTEKSGKAGKSTSSSTKASKSTYYSGNSTSLDFNSTTTLTTTEGEDDFNSTSLIIEEDNHNNSTSSKSGKSSSSAKSSKSIHGNSTSLFEVDYRNSTTLIEANNTDSASLTDEVDSLFS